MNGTKALNNYMASHPSYNDFLAHHGIKGMKWGVRRYQNPDGSLTEAGRKRYFSNGTDWQDHYTKTGAKEAGKDLYKLSKIRYKHGMDSTEYSNQLNYIHTKWGEGADGVSDWAGEHKGAMDRADKLWEKGHKKEVAERRKAEAKAAMANAENVLKEYEAWKSKLQSNVLKRNPELAKEREKWADPDAWWDHVKQSDALTKEERAKDNKLQDKLIDASHKLNAALTKY